MATAPTTTKTFKKTPRMGRPTKILNICKGFDYNKISLHPVAVDENNGAISFDWVYQENENDRKHNVQLFFDIVMILWGFGLGYSDEKDNKRTKEDWECGWVFEIKCPQGKLRYNKEKDCYEGSPVQRINTIFNNIHQLQKRMMYCMSNTKTMDGDIIFENLALYINRMIRFDKKNGAPNILIKMKGDSDYNKRTWTCKTKIFKGKSEELYENPTALVESRCFKFVGSLNVDLMAFVKCAKPVMRMKCQSISMYNRGSSTMPVSRPEQPEAEEYVAADFGLEDEQPEDEINDEAMAKALDDAQTRGHEKASIEFNDRNHQEDFNQPPKRARHDDEQDEDDYGGDEQETAES